jgi:hypothetical protein
MAVSLQVAPTIHAPAAPSVAPWALHFCDHQFGNFGDDLNPWLWQRLLPGQLSASAENRLVGIGTLLNHELPEGPKLIAGAGVGLGMLPTVDDSWDILFVRGPKTADALGLPRELAITDPAYLIRRFVQPARSRKGVVFMPHHLSALKADWRRVAEAAGLKYVDPTAPIPIVIEALRSATQVVTCSMHGAIVADALRTPWVRVKPYAHLNDFKWSDWAESVDVTVESHRLPALYDRSSASFARRAALTVRAWQRTGRPGRVDWSYLRALKPVSHRSEFALAAATLGELRNPSFGTLSAERVLNDRLARLNDAVASLARRRRRASTAATHQREPWAAGVTTRPAVA